MSREGAFPGAVAPAGRDLRVDFLRGLALLVICVNHSEQIGGRKLLSYITHSPFGYSDASALFVFLSGYVFGMVYQKRYEGEGFLFVQSRIVKRVLQLYAYNLAVFAAVYLMLFGQAAIFGNDIMVQAHLGEGSDHIFDLLLMKRFPLFFDILPLYILILFFAPFFLWLIGRSAPAALALSFGIYGATQLAFVLQRVDLVPFKDHAFIPSAWQLLFVLGLFFGVNKYRRRGEISYRKKIAVAAAVIMIPAFLNHKVMRLFLLVGVLGEHEYLGSLPFDREVFSPLLVVHFFLLAYVFNTFFPREPRFFNSPPARAVIRCGQNSLEVFSLQIVLTYLVGSIMVLAGGGAVLMVLLDAAAVALCLASPALLFWKKG